jgi:hypothetical protein
MPIWISGSDLQHPPFEVSKHQLLDWIKSGKVIPYEEAPLILFPDPGEPAGLRRIMPTPELEQLRGVLASARYELDWSHDWLAIPDQEHDREERELLRRIPGFTYADPTARRGKLEASIPAQKEEIERLEKLLSPVKVWATLDTVHVAWQDRILQMLMGDARYSDEEIRHAFAPPALERLAQEASEEAELLYKAILKELHDRELGITTATQQQVHDSLKYVRQELKLKHLGSIEIPAHLCALKSTHPHENFVQKMVQLVAKKHDYKISLGEAESYCRRRGY